MVTVVNVKLKCLAEIFIFSSFSLFAMVISSPTGIFLTTSYTTLKGISTSPSCSTLTSFIVVLQNTERSVPANCKVLSDAFKNMFLSISTLVFLEMNLPAVSNPFNKLSLSTLIFIIQSSLNFKNLTLSLLT